MKKRILSTILVLVLVFAFTTHAFAESAPVYGAGTCTVGFNTSRYVDRAGTWNATIKVYNYYVIWDNTWEYDFYQSVFAKNGSTQLSDPTVVFTGWSSQNGGGPVYSNASTNRSLYTPLYDELDLYANAANHSTIYLRINKPNDINWLNDLPISNMKTWGWFTK